VGRPDFPKSLKEFQARFRDEAGCRQYLAACRWPEGFRCGQCGRAEAFALPQRQLWQCKGCGRQVSVTAGTVLHRTRVPLTVWFWAAYLVTTHTPGLSAVQLQRQLGVSYAQIEALDEELGRIVAADEVARHLTTVPGVGPVTATAFVATVDDVTRFPHAHQVEAYLGLIPCEWSSSETSPRAHHQGGEWPHALAPGPGRVVHSAPAPATRDGRAARLGGSDCRTARSVHRRGGSGAAPGGDPVCDLAGWDRL
jgi:transposase-like protein